MRSPRYICIAATIACLIGELQIRRSSRKMTNPVGIMEPHVLMNRNRGNRQSDYDFLGGNLVPFREIFQTHMDGDFAHKWREYRARWPPEKVS
jgi:hypothetical protein